MKEEMTFLDKLDGFSFYGDLQELRMKTTFKTIRFILYAFHEQIESVQKNIQSYADNDIISTVNLMKDYDKGKDLSSFLDLPDLNLVFAIDFWSNLSALFKVSMATETKFFPKNSGVLLLILGYLFGKIHSRYEEDKNIKCLEDILAQHITRDYAKEFSEEIHSFYRLKESRSLGGRKAKSKYDDIHLEVVSWFLEKKDKFKSTRQASLKAEEIFLKKALDVGIKDHQVQERFYRWILEAKKLNLYVSTS